MATQEPGTERRHNDNCTSCETSVSTQTGIKLDETSSFFCEAELRKLPRRHSVLAALAPVVSLKTRA